MRTHVITRKTHKWLGLFVGLQLVVWSLTGLYMTVVHIDIIHGDHLVRTAAPSPVDAGSLADPLALAAGRQATDVRLVSAKAGPAWLVKGPGGESLIDARSGTPVQRPSEADIRAIARAIYTGSGPIVSARLITDIPGEIRGRKPPLWRVEFDHWNKPTLYFSPVTGELVTRRHELWRIFDFAWMLHIMDYETRDHVNNSLLRVFTIAALLLAVSGGWLLFYAFPKKKKKKARA